MKLPVITVRREGRAFTLEFDGERIEYPVAAHNGIEVRVSDGDVPTVVVTFIARRVEVVNEALG